MKSQLANSPIFLRLNVAVSEQTYATAIFDSLVHRKRLTVLTTRSFPQIRKQLCPDCLPADPLFWLDDEDSRSMIARWRAGDELVLVKEQAGVVQVKVAGNSHQRVKETIAAIDELLPEQQKRHDLAMPITFWSFGSGGAEASVRELKLVSWLDIEKNYPGPTGRQLAELMGRSEPTGTEGRLLLWHGEPGTGKTFAIRALAWAWRDWCDFHYVIDPEQLFGNGTHLWDLMLDRVFSPTHIPTSPNIWRILIIEDSGELIAFDAKSQTGQGLSRLLNLSDGILGQGTKIMILITTNEELGKLNPAINRPGRCLSEIPFRRFDRDEAAAWLRQAQCPSDAHGSPTLSELYQTRAGRHLLTNNAPSIGFVSAPR